VTIAYKKIVVGCDVVFGAGSQFNKRPSDYRTLLLSYIGFLKRSVKMSKYNNGESDRLMKIDFQQQ
jgi:hypothetical protein